MKFRLPFQLRMPLLYVNPCFHPTPELVEQVSSAGGMGIVDHVTSYGFNVSPDISHGIRIRLDRLDSAPVNSGTKIALLPLEDAERLTALKPAALALFGLPVLAEVESAAQAAAAEKAGAAGLVIKGNEGPGRVSETSGLVLLQQVLAAAEIPVFLQGGVTFRTAAGAVAAGAAGVVLDVHLLLTESSRLGPALKEFLRSLGFPASVTLGETTGTPVRVYSRIGTRMVREFKKLEETLAPEDFAVYRDRLSSALAAPVSAPDTDEALLALSEDIISAAKLAADYKTAGAVVREFGTRMLHRKAVWPFNEDSAVCRDHKTRFPIVQGPMAHVSDNPDFLASVAAGGALPFLAMGNMPGPIAREGIVLAREKTGGRFGVGLIGLEINRQNYETHLEIMKDNPPPYAILAAGGPDLARRIEAQGTLCYMHCPSPAVLSEGLKTGLRRFVFEGCESGGHVGLLASLNLWSANLAELETAASHGLALNEVTVLFAGGIATGRAAAFVAGMVADLVDRGLNVGLQMGTAYLTSLEAVSTCAITPTYQKLTLESLKTVVIGRTVNIRARAAGSPMASTLIQRELDRLRDGTSLAERKELYEKDNLGCLRLASKGCAIDPDTATWDCPVFCDLEPEEQLQRGLYLMGQAVCLLDKPATIEALHAEIIEGGKRIFASTQETSELPGDDEAAFATEQVVEVEHEREPIAVVGIGLRFPGSHSPETFWEHIVDGQSGIIPVPDGRWADQDFFYDPDPKVPDKTYSKIGGFIPDLQFDPLKYRIPPSVARQMDRTQQMAVTCVADAIEDAGLSPGQLKGKRVGIIIGNSMGGEKTDLYAERVNLPKVVSSLEKALESSGLNGEARNTLLDEFRSDYLKRLPEITEDSLPGELANVISGRVANVFDLAGPNFTVDAACASSMAAVMNAVAALRDGKIDFALTGGVDAAMHPSSFVKFCKVGALSPDGSRPFDEAANGFVMGEGAGIMVLKRLSDALRDKDRIYATILEVGSSSDGRGKGITAPNAAGQERAVQACLESGSIEPNSLGLIEAHGTSTPVGDSTELTVLDRFFRSAGMSRGSLGIGSVKSQIGHLKAAAGAAGMIKAALSLHHRTLPPTINVKKPNPCIDWETSPLFLVTQATPWERRNGYLRRAGVSAFGFGGTNFHVVFQEYFPGLQVVSGKKQVEQAVEFVVPDWPRPPEFEVQGETWVLGGTDAADISARVEALLKELNPDNAANIAHRLRRGAGECAVRCGFAADNAETATKKLELIRDAITDPSKMPVLRTRGIHVAEGESLRARAGVAFLFPGQGSQYPFMLRDLAERFPVVAQTLQEADDVLVSLGLPPVTDSMFPSETAGNGAKNHGDVMKDTQLLQPMILTANTAIFRLLARFNVRPVACAGHSLGEYAACVAAGVFSFRDAVEAVAVRGREMARVSIADPGLMMSVPADARIVEEVLAEVDGYVVAANKNSPKQTVVSGETEAVKKAGDLFKERGLDGIILPVSAAFHSGVVAPAREPFMKTLEKLNVNPPSVPVLSNVTGDFYPVGPAAPGRIRDLLGKQFAAPVEWVKTLRRLYSEGVRTFLECGPKRVMTNLTLDTLSNDVLALATNHPKKGGILQLMETLAALAAEGIPVDFSGGSVDVESHGAQRSSRRPELKIVQSVRETVPVQTSALDAGVPELLEGLLDPELREIAGKKEFQRFLEIQGEPIRGLIKSGFQTFVKNVLPMEQTVRQVKSEGMDFKPAVISGISAGLPSDVRFPFDRESLDDLILGRNFIKKVSKDGRRNMLEKNVERLVKGPSGEADLQVVEDLSGVIKLAGYFGEEEFIAEYGLDERLVRAMDVTTRLAVAAGIEALRDAGIPLIRMTRTTSTGHELPDAWALPPALRQETGIIFASAFPGMSSLVDEVTRQTAAQYGSGAKKRLIDFYTGLVERIRDDRERERVTKWFTEEFHRFDPGGSEEMYTFNRDFLLRVMSMAHGQLAQLIKAQGPNTHVDAACAGTTQAVILARDWIRTGQAKRVIVIAADDVAGKTLLPWIGSGFLAMGAATTNGTVSEAALPFDDRRHGLILGSAAAGIIVESQELVSQRGMEGIATIEAGIAANSGFHGTRLDVEHISAMMEKMVERWEEQSGNSRNDLAKNVFFMSHETYSPKRGGSSAAEIRSLRNTFGDAARQIPIANTKGFTGHTMGVGVEDVVALRCLQKKMLPPIPNLKQPDPEFADLNLSRGGSCEATYALRLAAGFGSQIVMALYKAQNREENRISDLAAHRNWLRELTGYNDPVLAVEERTLRCTERSVEKTAGVKPAAAKHPDRREKHATAVAAVAANDGEIRDKILALLSDKTGYPADMLDTGLDLEADLGIDTVKQAEFISEVREAFGIPRIDGLKIAEFPTIEHIITFVVLQTNGGVSDQVTQTGAEAQSATTDDAEAVREKILELLSHKTGYPPDMLDTGLDLEADLGIDTVKQAEFISEVRDTFGIPRIEGLKIAEFPTINHIIDFVLERKRSEEPEEPVTREVPHSEKTPMVQQEIKLYEARLVRLPALEKVGLPEADRIFVVGGPQETSREVEASLGALGYSSITCISEPTLPESIKTGPIGIVNLLPLEKGDVSLRKTFELYVSCAVGLDNGPSFLVTALCEDAAFGFEDPAQDAEMPGAVAGATKAFAREYPDTCVRILDLHPELPPAERAAAVARSLVESFPVETGVATNGELRTVRLVPILEESDEPAVKSGDVLLVTGGARGITAECIKHLAAQRQLTIAILARTALSGRGDQFAEFGPQEWEEEKKRIVDRIKRSGKAATPVMVEKELAGLKGEAEALRTIRELKSLGAEVMYTPADIRDAASVDRAILGVAETCGRVDVVIHGAGIDVSRALRSKTVEQIENVVSVKVRGMRNILSSLNRHGVLPRRIVAFGSVSGRFGNLAQVDYSAANDALAHMLRRVDRDLDAKVSVIDWAPWAEVGMATRGSVQQTLEAAGIDFIPPKAGTEILARELSRTGGGSEVLAAGRLGPFAADAFSVPGEHGPAEKMLAGQKGRVISFLPGEYVRLSVTLDPSHPVLDHHRIDRAAVLPGVAALEIMRTAAALLDADAAAASFEKVRFRSPLKIFKSDPFEAEVEVVRTQAPDGQDSAFRARTFSWFVDKEGHKIGSPRTHHECRLLIGPKKQVVSLERSRWEESIWISDKDVYAAFFHGPAFMLLNHLLLEGNGRGIRFTYRDTDQRPSMFSPVPSGIEAIFQAGAGLALETRRVTALPTGVEQVVVHSNDLPYEGELETVRVTKDGPDSRLVFTFNAILRGRDGNALVELKGVEMMELTASPGFPGKIFEQTVAVAHVIKEMEKAPDEYLNSILGQEESKEHTRKMTPKRAAEWLAGRIAVKKGVQRFLAAVNEPAVQHKGIRVIQDDQGKPRVELVGRPGLSLADVSISHSNGLAMAAAAVPGEFAGLGIDVEKVEVRSDAWVKDYFADEEIRSAGDAETRWVKFTKMWSLKEAALKAIGTGLRFDLKDICITSLDDTGKAGLEFRNEAGRYLEGLASPELDARVQEQDGLVMARVLIRNK
ncbi:MAG TPA: SDR family NAD(P)-dependent oxidoreductase [Desulfomonilaceae bacterium]|nr:SDR family NAD(P)-dependent oxidoreductase [Desulfomonilaceae bacterium]